MSESTLTVDYATLVRECARKLAEGETYSTGTVTIVAGVATLAGGIWPTWASSAAIQIGDLTYGVDVRTSGTAITLEDTSVTAAALTRFVLQQTFKDDKALAMAHIRDIINKAYRDSLSPPAVAVKRIRKTLNDTDEIQSFDLTKTPDMWSFLRRSATLALVAGTTDYDLPDDFAGVSSEWMVIVNNIPYAIALNNSGHVETITRPGRGIPKYCGVKTKSDYDPTVGQRHQVIFNIAPNDAFTVRYHYNFAPGALNPTNRYPVGGYAFSSVVLAAVLYHCELYLNCDGAQHQQEFMSRLQAMLQIDIEARDSEPVSFATERPLYSTYDWLRQELASKLGESPNYWAWSHTLMCRMDNHIQRGLAMFYECQPSPNGHVWSWLSPAFFLELNAPQTDGTITVVNGVATIDDAVWPDWVLSGEVFIDDTWYRVKKKISDTEIVLDSPTLNAAAETTYELRHNFMRLENSIAGIEGPLNYETVNDVSATQIMFTNRPKIDFLRKSRGISVSMSPAFFTVNPVTDPDAEPYYELVLWPAPDKAYRVHGTARLQPDSLGPGQFLPCGRRHAEAALAACLAASDEKYLNVYIAKLTDARNADEAGFTAESVGLNLDRSDERRQYTLCREWDNYTLTYEGQPISHFQ